MLKKQFCQLLFAAKFFEKGPNFPAPSATLTVIKVRSLMFEVTGECGQSIGRVVTTTFEL